MLFLGNSIGLAYIKSMSMKCFAQNTKQITHSSNASYPKRGRSLYLLMREISTGRDCSEHSISCSKPHQGLYLNKYQTIFLSQVYHKLSSFVFPASLHTCSVQYRLARVLAMLANVIVSDSNVSDRPVGQSSR